MSATHCCGVPLWRLQQIVFQSSHSTHTGHSQLLVSCQGDTDPTKLKNNLQWQSCESCGQRQQQRRVFFLNLPSENGIFILGAQCRLVVYLSRDTRIDVAVEEEKRKRKLRRRPGKPFSFFFFLCPAPPTLVYLDITSLSTAQAALTEIAQAFFRKKKEKGV